MHVLLLTYGLRENVEAMMGAMVRLPAPGEEVWV